MGRLLRDRYFTDEGTHAWDLATGEIVRVDGPPEDQPTASPPLAEIAEVLEHGLEGAPRRLVIDASPETR